jgi:hypothetical protein
MINSVFLSNTFIDNNQGRVPLVIGQMRGIDCVGDKIICLLCAYICHVIFPVFFFILEVNFLFFILFLRHVNISTQEKDYSVYYSCRLSPSVCPFITEWKPYFK